MHEVTERIRSLINEPKKQHALLKQEDLWSQLCSSLDAIEDCAHAIAAYSGGEVSASKGAHYLAVYGLLQALYLQQDAVFHLCESLGVKKTVGEWVGVHPRLGEIREIRNASAGHPTKKDRPKSLLTTYNFISQATMSLNGFDLLTWDSAGKFQSRCVSIPNLINNQREEVSGILDSLIERLAQEENAHKEKFRMDKLAAVFPHTLTYHFSKVFEGIRKGELQFAAINLEQITKALESFKEALASRGIELETYDSIKYLYDQLEHPLGRLQRYLNDQTSGTGFGPQDATIFVFFVEKKVEDLKRIAQEIDNEYSL